ncbi:hypothetical protein [Streptomyces roseolilacinus]|uniref:hypothetical protein n=1 Tax=Streptomyces roseolilacinus TaxID=66904 RepID=UPI00380D573F
MAVEDVVAEEAVRCLRLALGHLYDLVDARTPGRTPPSPGAPRPRASEPLWRQVHAVIARQVEADRRNAATKAPGRITTFHWQTFQALRADLRRGTGATRDRQPVLEALSRLGEPYLLPFGLRLALAEVAGEMGRPAGPAGDGGRSHLVLLEETSARARRETLLLGRGPEDTEVSLRDVYVARGAEERLAGILLRQAAARQPGQPVQLVLGEAGTGKTSLLWYLSELVEGRRTAGPRDERRTRPPSDERRAGAAARPVLLRAELLLSPGEGGRLLHSLELATRQRRPRAGTVALLDTADLLLHSADGRDRLREVVGVCRKQGVPLAVTCRTRDAAALQRLLGREPSEVALRLGDFRYGGELERALSAYCRRYLPDGSPAARAETVTALLEAAVRGLPVREVVARPLTLRMLFEVYAPHSPKPEIDAAGLYDRYWEWRVAQDVRHGSAGAAAPAADLSWPAQGLARLMLHDGVVALPAGDVAGRMAGANPEAGDADPLEQLARLEGRSVILGAGAGGREEGAVRFFHQTLFEYAAGRCLVRLASERRQSYYAALGRHLRAHPDDFLRAVVAEQALVQGMRADGRVRDDAADLLTDLLDSEDVDLQVIAVRAYALLPDDVFGDVRERFHRYLRERATTAMVRELLAVLPTREHADPRRVVEDAAVVLRHHSRMERRVLDLLCRFGRIDRGTADAVRSLLRTLCADTARCVERRVSPDGPEAAGCGGPRCLWSWLVNLGANDAGSHGNHAVRLVDALGDHRSEWAADRMRELLALAERHRSRIQALQCVSAVLRRSGDADWDAVFPVAAGIAQRLGTDKAVDGGAEETARDDEDGGAWDAPEQAEEWRRAQAVLDAHWFASAPGRTPAEVVRALAAEGTKPFDVEAARLRAVLGQVGERLRREPEGVPGLLEETVALCAGRDVVDDVAAHLLPPLLAEPADDPGTRAAAEWCADRIGELPSPRGGRAGAAAVRFAVGGLSRLPPARSARIVPWPSAGRPWGDDRTDGTFLVLHGAARLVVPLAAAGHARAFVALERWRALEKGRHDQQVRGGNEWPAFLGGRPYHGRRVRDAMSGLIQAALADHAPHAPELLEEALRHRVPQADVPWLAKLAKATLEQPAPSAAGLALFDRFGPDLAEWCADLWGTAPCPDPEAKAAALRLWGHLVRLGAADRPALAAQARVAGRVTRGHWRTFLRVLRDWNGHDVSAIASASGEPGWEELDAALASADVPDGTGADTALLGLFLRCRFAPLATAEDVAEAVGAVTARIACSTRTDTIHETGAGFLVERLCATDPSRAVEVTLAVARQSAGGGLDDPHHVTRLGWKWQKPLTRLAVTAGRDDWLELVAGLAGGPRSMLQKALDTAAAHRRDEDVRADAESRLAGSPYRDLAMAGLRDAAVRHRRAPLAERRWPAVLAPADS